MYSEKYCLNLFECKLTKLSMGEFYFHFLHIFTITPPLNIFAIALNVVFSSKAKKSFSSSWILWKTFFFKVGEELFERNSWNCNEVMLIQWILRKFFSTCFQLLDVSGSLCIFCFKSNLWNVGKKSPLKLKKMHTQIVTRPFYLIGCGLSG